MEGRSRQAAAAQLQQEFPDEKDQVYIERWLERGKYYVEQRGYLTIS